MIKFEIIGMTHNLNGIHEYNLNQLRIGKRSGQLIINQLQRNHLISFNIEPSNQLTIHSTEAFSVNQNKLKDRANLKANDLITFQEGSVKIKIHDFHYSKHLKLKDHVNAQLDKLIKEENELVSVLSSIKS